MTRGFGRALMLTVSAGVAVAWVGGIGSSATAMAAATSVHGEANQRLSQVINRAIRAEGPFFNAEEQALIARKCGYAPGEWDGHDISMSNEVLTCKNGRKVDDPEVRAMLRVAQPRIQERVGRAMAQPEVKAAIEQVSQEATRRALARIDHGKIRREAARAAREAMREARLEAERGRRR